MNARIVAGDFRRERPEVIGGAGKELFALQLAQFQHDETYHREVARLSVHQRLNHMALHFAKYVGRIAGESADSEDHEKFDQTIVDSFVIALSTANILNLKLSDSLERSSDSPTLSEFGATLLRQDQPASLDVLHFLRELAIAVGEMAKACESVDHLEAYPFREKISESLLKISRTLIKAMAWRRINPSQAVHARLEGVKAKSIFHGHI